MSREELENMLEERKEFLERNGFSYGEWQLDNEYNRIYNELVNINTTNINNDIDTRVNTKDYTINSINLELDNLDKLIHDKELYFSSNGIPYGEWQLDNEYSELIGRKENLVKEKDKLEREIDEIERQIKFKENEFLRNDIPYGEWQLDSEYVSLCNHLDILKGNTLKSNIINNVDKVNSVIYNESNDDIVNVDNFNDNIITEDKIDNSNEIDNANTNTNTNTNNNVDTIINDTNTKSNNNVEVNTKDNTNDGEVLKVVSKKKWSWVKDHKKDILISLGIAAITVSMIVTMNQLIPAIIAATKASQLSNAASSMANNASLWHGASAGEQVALHGTNTGLSSVISSMTGKNATFNSISGSWTIGGSSLGEFAMDAASKASIALSKVRAISGSVIGLGVGGIGLTGLGAFISDKNKSEKYNQYKNELKEIREDLSVCTYDDIFTVLPDFTITTKHIEDDNDLSNDERRILLAKAQKIANRISLIEKKGKKKEKNINKEETSNKEYDEVEDVSKNDINNTNTDDNWLNFFQGNDIDNTDEVIELNSDMYEVSDDKEVKRGGRK